MKEWKEKPIFISSTLKDFQVERKYIREHVIPEIKSRLIGMGIYLEFIDLRYGLDLKQDTCNEQEELCVLRVCLDEINRCIPFLIILMGDCYGYVPSNDELEGNLNGDLTTEEKSVTAYEINYGLFENNSYQSYVYCREALPYVLMLPEVAKLYSDEYGNRNHFIKLQKLKERIKQVLPKDHIRTYKTRWNFALNSIHPTSLRKLGEQIIHDVLLEINKQLKIHGIKEGDDKLIDDFIEMNSNTSAGRIEIIEKLILFALDKDKNQQILCLVGKRDSGKSVILCEVMKELFLKNCILLRHVVGVSRESRNLTSMLHRFIKNLAKHINTTVKPKDNFEEMNIQFLTLLQLVATKKRVICVIDGISQFVGNDIHEFLKSAWPLNARVITSSRVEFNELNNIIHMSPLNQEDNKKIKNKFLQKYSGVECKVKKQILDKYIESPLYLHTVLEAITNLPDVVNIPDTISELYQLIMEKTITELGKSYTLTLVKIIVESRFGLRSNDLKVLIHNITGMEWNDLDFSYFKRYLHSELSTNNGSWYFNHVTFIEFIKSKYLSNSSEKREINQKIVTYLETLEDDDRLKQNELMFHYYQANLKVKAIKLIGLASNASLSTIETLIVDCNALEWFIDLLKTNVNDKKMYHLHTGYHDLINRLCTKIPNEQWIAFLEALEKSEKILLQKDASNRRVLKNLFNSYLQLGDFYLKTTDFTKAKQYYENSLALIQENNDHHDLRSDLVTVYLRLADLYQSKTKENDAFLYYEKSLQISEALLLLEPNNIHYHEVLTNNYQKLGLFHLKKLEFTDSFDYFLRSLNISKELVNISSNPLYKEELLQILIYLGDISRKSNHLIEAIDYYHQGIKISEEMIQNNPNNNTYKYTLATHRDTLGVIYEERNQLDNACKSHQTSIALLDGLVDLEPMNKEFKKQMAQSCDALANVYLKKSEYLKAKKIFIKSCQFKKALMQTEINYQASLANTYQQIGSLIQKTGDLKASITYFDKSISLYEELMMQDPQNNDFKVNIISLYLTLGKLYLNERDLLKAKKMFLKIFNINHTNVEQLLVCFKNLGDINLSLKDIDKAKENYEACIRSYDQIDKKTVKIKQITTIAHCFKNLGDIYLDLGESIRAKRFYEKSIIINKQNNDILITSYDQLAYTHMLLGECDKARLIYEKNLKVLFQLMSSTNGFHYKQMLTTTYSKLGKCHLCLNDLNKAYEYYLKAVKEESDSKISVFYFQKLGEISFQLANLTQAIEWLEKSIEIYEQSNIEEYNEDFYQALFYLGKIYLKLEKYRYAKVYFKRCLGLLKKGNEKNRIVKENYSDICLKLILINERLNNEEEVFTYLSQKQVIDEQLLEINSEDMGNKKRLLETYKKIIDFYKFNNNRKKEIAYSLLYVELIVTILEKEDNKINYLESLASRYHRIFKLEDNKAEMTYLEKYRDTLEKIVKIDNHELKHKEELVLCYEKLGDYTLKIEFYHHHQQLLQELVINYPNNLNYKHDLAQGYEKLGNYYIKQQDNIKALDFYEKTLEIYLLLIVLKPHSKNYHNNLLDIYYKLKQIYQELAVKNQNLEHFERCKQINEALYEMDSNNILHQENLYISYYMFGDFYLKNNGKEKAISLFEKCILILNKLIVLKENDFYKKDCAKINELLANIYQDMNKIGEALHYLKRSIEINKKIITKTSFEFEALAVKYLLLGDMYLVKKDKCLIKEAYESSLTLAKKLIAKDKSNVKYKEILIHTYLKLNQFHVKMGISRKAKKYYKKSYKIIKKLKSIDSQFDKFDKLLT